MTLCSQTCIKESVRDEDYGGFCLQRASEDPLRCEIAIHIGGYGISHRRKCNLPHDRQCYNRAERFFQAYLIDWKSGTEKNLFVVRLCGFHTAHFVTRASRDALAVKYRELFEAEYAAERTRARTESAQTSAQSISG